MLALFGALLSGFGSWQHVTIAGFIPSVPSMFGMVLGCGALFFSTVAWAALFRGFGMGMRLSLASGFLSGHLAFAAAALFPANLDLVYLLVFGGLGLGFAGLAVVRHARLSVLVLALAGLLLIPVVWGAIGFITFALAHANFFTLFFAERSIDGNMIDLLHQRAYLQMIQNFGVPSVGINGLGYHNYHWLVAYPLLTLANVTGLEMAHIHANMLPGFTGPVLVHGLAIGAVLAARRVLTGLIAVGLLALIYVCAVKFSPAITYGLIFLTPSTAYSMALFAAFAGLFLWTLNGNLTRLKTWHFLVFGAFVLVIGLAKTNTMLQAAILMGTLWVAFSLNRRTWFFGAGLATLILLVTAGGSLYLLLEILQHGRKLVSPPELYTAAFSALSEARQAALLADIKESLQVTSVKAATAGTAFERQVFYRTPLGAGMILLTVAVLLSLVGLPSLFKHRLYHVVWLLLGLSLLLLAQRSVFGYTTPTQVQYIALPPLLLGVLALSVAVGERLPRRLHKGFPRGFLGASKASDVPSFLLAGAVFCLALVALLTVHSSVTKEIRGQAVRTAVLAVGGISNQRGRQLIRRLTAGRVATLAAGNRRADWPPNVQGFWSSWEQRGDYRFAQRLKAFADTVDGGKVALFLPATSPYWQAAKQSSEPSSRMFWVQGAAGIVLYRGKLHPRGSLSQSFVGRGISDFGNESAALISDPDNVFCWDRFKGFTIINAKLEILLEC